MTAVTSIRPLAVITALALLALTGCSPDSGRPGPSTDAITISSPPSPTIDLSAGPPTEAPPASASEAIAAANRSLLGFYAASFASGHAGGTRLDLIAPWATGAALHNEQLVASYLQKKNLRLDGTPTAWTLDAQQSTVAQATGAQGQGSVPYGVAHLAGCIQSTNRPVGAGAPAWTTKGQRAFTHWTVLFDAAKQQWLVSDSSSIILSGGDSPCG